MATEASNNVTVIYDEAYDFAYRGEFDTAEKLFRKLVTRNDPIFGGISHQWVTIIRKYERIKTMAERKSTRKIAQGQWAIYTHQFPLDFIDGIFDPSNIDQLLQQTPRPQQVVPPTQKRVQPARIVTPSKSTSESLLATPFDWIEIPRKGYSIAKYPVTNLQFAEFIEAGGYKEKRWWTEAGWEAREEGWHYDSGWEPSGKAWTEPRYWGDSKWNGGLQPVVGVSWYEAVAFCLYLSEATSENIMLPTEDQWQYAAQGDDCRTYPWGNDWDCNRCNNSVEPCDNNVTTSVTEYEGKTKGDSPFGVVDMAGNVWEWGLTDYYKKTNDIHSDSTARVLRGGSWNGYNAGHFRCDCRHWSDPNLGTTAFGFRLSRS